VWVDGQRERLRGFVPPGLHAPAADPSSGLELHVGSLDGDTPSHCETTKAALDSCSQSNRASGTVTGPVHTCTWEVDEHSPCTATCNDNPKAVIEADCMGSPIGHQDCSCAVNGQYLGDESFYINAGYFLGWTATSCADAAEQLAAGKCQDILNCCFTWLSHDSPDAGPVERCGCTADPKAGGFDSCEAIAAQGHGKVVDICSRYMPNPGSFPH